MTLDLEVIRGRLLAAKVAAEKVGDMWQSEGRPGMDLSVATSCGCCQASPPKEVEEWVQSAYLDMEALVAEVERLQKDVIGYRSIIAAYELDRAFWKLENQPEVVAKLIDAEVTKATAHLVETNKKLRAALAEKKR